MVTITEDLIGKWLLRKQIQGEVGSFSCTVKRHNITTTNIVVDPIKWVSASLEPFLSFFRLCGGVFNYMASVRHEVCSINGFISLLMGQH